MAIFHARRLGRSVDTQLAEPVVVPQKIPEISIHQAIEKVIGSFSLNAEEKDHIRAGATSSLAGSTPSVEMVKASVNENIKNVVGTLPQDLLVTMKGFANIGHSVNEGSFNNLVANVSFAKQPESTQGAFLNS